MAEPSEPDPMSRDEIASAESSWGEPNERTRAVDAALVRVARALDAAAMAHDRRRPRTVELPVESAAASLLEFEISGGGRWHFVEGSWDADGQRQSSRLLRPSLRGVARATRPDFDEALAVVVRDVEVACAEQIARDGGVVTSVPATQHTIEELLTAAFPSLTAEGRAAVRAVAAPLDVAAGTTLMTIGQPGRELVFLVDGCVTVETDHGDVVLAPGSVVGERAVLTGARRNATVHTLTDCVLLVVADHDLSALPEPVRDLLGAKQSL